MPIRAHLAKGLEPAPSNHCARRHVDAGWTIGLAATVDWIGKCAEDDTLLFVDAPLIVDNTTGQRLCETEVGRRSWPWRVPANTTNLGSRNLAGVALLQELVADGWRYDDGRDCPPRGGRIVSECYPYTAIVGVAELGFDIERPRYKRQPKGMPTESCPVEQIAHVCRAGQLLAPISWRNELRASARVRGMLV